MTLDELFLAASVSPWQDMNAHVNTLREFASKCDVVTEFGVRGGVSTAALLAGRPKMLISYDIAPFAEAAEYIAAAEAESIKFIFKQQDDCKELILPTEFLLIDTEHNYQQLEKELRMHAHLVSRWIAMHDTHMELYPPAHPQTSYEMWKAINDLIDGGEWMMVIDNMYCSGLTVLERAK